MRIDLLTLYSYRGQDDGDLFGDRTSERYSTITPTMERQALEDELQYMREPVTLAEDLLTDRYGSSGTMKIPKAVQLNRAPSVSFNPTDQSITHSNNQSIIKSVNHSIKPAKVQSNNQSSNQSVTFV